ncbi:MAG: insulinase family protein, partial [Muribaculaceae bacterium]|nr:insulinase family protein [Muribaculaceae bacterium]
YTGVGLMTVYFGCDAEDLDKCNRLCEGVFRKIADGGLSARRFEMAKKQYLGQYALACENRENRIMALARAALFRGLPPTVEDTVEAIHSITLNDISAIAHDMCDASSLTFLN